VRDRLPQEEWLSENKDTNVKSRATKQGMGSKVCLIEISYF